MCGKKSNRGPAMFGHGLKSMAVTLLLLLSLSAASLQADALSDLQEILTSYEQITLSLDNRLKASELNTSALSISIGSMNNSLTTLQDNSKSQEKLLDSQKASIAEMQMTLSDSDKQIKDLQTGYLKMERKYSLMKTLAISSFSIAILSIAFNIIVLSLI